MSSLRLALKQSLKEAVRDGKVPMRTQLDDEEDEWNDDKTLETPAPLRRKRGRPRKHPQPEPRSENQQDEEQFSSENEFSAGDEDEHDEDEGEGFESDERSQERSRSPHTDAAHRIQTHWKRRKEQQQKKPSEPSAPTNRTVSPTPLNNNNNVATDNNVESTSTKQHSKATATSRPKTVPPPSQQLVSWQSWHLSVKRARRYIAPGLRVKVRFALRKEGGKRKKKWFGGRITAVSKEGSKVRIKYDDGTTEVTKFPDKDIVIDDSLNGEHQAAAGIVEKFVPPADVELSPESHCDSQDGVEEQEKEEGAEKQFVIREKEGERREFEQKTESEQQWSVPGDSPSNAQKTYSNLENPRGDTPSPSSNMEDSKEDSPPAISSKKSIMEESTNPNPYREENTNLLTEAVSPKPTDFSSSVSDLPTVQLMEPANKAEPALSIPSTAFENKQSDSPPMKEFTKEAPLAMTMGQPSIIEPQLKRKRGRPPKHRPSPVDAIETESSSPSPIFPAKQKKEVSCVNKSAGIPEHEITDSKQVGSGKTTPIAEEVVAPVRSSLTIRIPLIKNDGIQKSPKPASKVILSKTTEAAGDVFDSFADGNKSTKKKRSGDDHGLEESSEERASSKRIHIALSSQKVALADSKPARSPAASPRHKKKRKLLENGELLGKLPPSLPLVNVTQGKPSKPAIGSENSAFEKKVVRQPDSLQNSSEEGDFDGVGGMTPQRPPRPKNKQDENASAVRSGRRAAQQANERIVTKPDAVPDLSKNKKRKRKEGEDTDNQQDHTSAVEDDSQWVQCDACGKWRIIPSSVVASLPKQWYCKDNVHDPKRASCDAPEQTAKQVIKERKRMKRRQQRLMMEAAAAAAAEEPQDGKDVSCVEIVKENTDRVRSPRPVVENVTEEPVNSKRASPPIVPSITGDIQQKADKKMAVLVNKKGRIPEATATVVPPDPLADQPSSEIRRGRGRPRRNCGQNKDSGSGGTKDQSDEADNLEWVQCEKCDKWRKLPPHISADDLPEVWYCSMNTWNSNLTCEDPEDKADGLQDVNMLEPSGGCGKLSYRNLIFGNTGRKANRPISERTRAAESLFGTITEDEDNPPAVMYSNRSAFVSRSKAALAAEENRGPSFFDFMKNSNLWNELRVNQSNGISGKNFNGLLNQPAHLCAYTFETLPDDVKHPLKELLLEILGSATLSGDDVMLQAKYRNRDDLSEACAKARAFCTINVVVTGLCDLVRDGLVEVVRENGVSNLSDWNPRYRRLRNITKSFEQMNEETNEAAQERKESRCMKIAKPWKRVRIH